MSKELRMTYIKINYSLIRNKQCSTQNAHFLKLIRRKIPTNVNKPSINITYKPHRIFYLLVKHDGLLGTTNKQKLIKFDLK